MHFIRRNIECFGREKKIIRANETLISWYLKNHLSYYNSFLRLFKYKELIDVDLPHGLGANLNILRVRIGLPLIDNQRLQTALDRATKEESEVFLQWIYTGITNNQEVIKEFCTKLGINFNAKNSISSFIRDIRFLYEIRNETGNFKIIVDGTEIPVHRVILVARSNMFRNMLLNVTVHSNQVTDRSGLSLPAFNALIEFIYTGQITNLTQDISNELLEKMAAPYFQLPEGELEKYLERAQD